MNYSPSKNSFFPPNLEQVYRDAGSWPNDCVEITPEQHAALLQGQSEGKIIAADENGYPVLQEPTQPTADQMADTARAKRDRLIESVRWRIERHSDELALGIEPTEPLEPLLQHTQALRDVPQQAGFPESVEWPQCP